MTQTEKELVRPSKTTILLEIINDRKKYHPGTSVVKLNIQDEHWSWEVSRQKIHETLPTKTVEGKVEIIYLSIIYPKLQKSINETE